MYILTVVSPQSYLIDTNSRSEEISIITNTTYKYLSLDNSVQYVSKLLCLK